MLLGRLQCFVYLLAIQLTQAVQLPIDKHASPDIWKNLASIPGEDQFISLKSKNHPAATVKVKSHKGWCDPSVKSMTGYIDAGFGKELFFYFFESRSNPEKDPVVMWINGGPGGSSAMGLFMEQGPCRINHDPKSPNDTTVNPFAWNERASIFFLDQPIDVGFSHAENGQTVGTTEAAAKDVAAFIDIFFDTFTEYQGLAFHMSGESYAGRYLPIFASALYDQNVKLVKQGRTPVNLKSVMIGNGATSIFKIVESVYPLLCTSHRDLGYAVLDIGHCVELAEKIPKCKKMLQKHCLDTSDSTTCSMWMRYCEDLSDASPGLAGVSRFNVNQSCTPAQEEKNGCLDDSERVEQYLNLPATRALLGIHHHTQNYSLSSDTVSYAFEASLDFSHQTYYYVANLLERGIKILNYVGTLDAACDHFAQTLWMDEMPWTGRNGYLAAPVEEWRVDGTLAGEYKTFGDLSFLKIYGAGHLVPTDRPKEALAMLNEWIGAFDS